jgi:HCOMODA/2-hydroxy-3-carboxy-muconic semialdehyde decarboxylase
VPQSSLHQAIYKGRADVKAVFHFHSPAVILLSVVGQTIRSMHNYSAIFYEGVPLYTGTGQVESPARASEMTGLLGNAKALMLRGHGAVVVGQSIREVCMLALFLEESRGCKPKP